MVFDIIARFIEKHAREIIVVEVLLTALLISVIPGNFRFESDLNKFLPDNPETQAHERVQDKFGHDPSTYFIHVEPKSGDNVLTPDAVRDQKRIEERIATSPGRSQDDITGVLSLAGLIEMIYKVNGGEKDSLIQAPDEDILTNTTKTINWLNATNPDNFNGVWRSLIDYAERKNDEDMKRLVRSMTPKDLMVLKDALLSIDLYKENQRPWQASSTLIIVWINGSLDPQDRKEIAVSLRDHLDGTPLNETKMKETGADLLANDVDEMTQVSNLILGVGTLIIILVVLYLVFRSVSYMMLPVITMLLAIIWTIGTMIIIGVTFTAIDVAAIPLIVGLGVDDSVHLSKRYQEELKKCGKPSVALVTSIDKIGTAIFLTSLTTALAFMSNMVSPVGPIRDFGLICATGIAYAFILTITFQAALRYELDRYGVKSPEGAKDRSPKLESGMRRFGGKVLDNPKPVVAIVLLLTVSSIWASSYVRTDFRVEDFLPHDWETVDTYQDIESAYKASSQSRVYYVIEGDVATVDMVWALDELEQETENDRRIVSVEMDPNSTSDDVYRMDSILYYFELAIWLDGDLAGEYKFDGSTYRPLPNCTDADVQGFFDYLRSNETFTYLTRAVISGEKVGEAEWDFDTMIVRMFVDARSETSKAREVTDDMDHNIDAVGLPSGVKITKAGYVISTISTIRAIQKSQIDSTIISIIISALILMFIYRSFTIGVLAALPVAICASWVLGMMAFTEYMYANVSTAFPDISLNVLTVMVTALTIGLGIDYSIHIIQRFKEEREERGAEVREAMLTSISHSGTAIFISMITTVLGFVVLLFSPMPITQHFGLITSVTMIFAFFLCIFFLPILLMVWAKKEEARAEEGGGKESILSKLRPKPRPVEISIAGEVVEEEHAPADAGGDPTTEGTSDDEASVIVIVDEE